MHCESPPLLVSVSVHNLSSQKWAHIHSQSRKSKDGWTFVHYFGYSLRMVVIQSSMCAYRPAAKIHAVHEKAYRWDIVSIFHRYIR